jgi:hypothetical protein
MIEILKSLIGAAGGATAIVLTAWFALRRFRSEKWWERKADTYAAIFEAMDNLLEEVDLLTDEEITRNVITPEHRTKLAEVAGLARRQIRKASRVGSFLLSEQSERILVSLLENLERARSERDYFSHLDANWGILIEALNKLKREAKAGLGV